METLEPVAQEPAGAKTPEAPHGNTRLIHHAAQIAEWTIGERFIEPRHGFGGATRSKRAIHTRQPIAFAGPQV